MNNLSDFVKVMESLVILYFSKDRPLQLDLALRSNSVCSEFSIFQKEYVLYNTSNERYEKAYERLKSEHHNVTFIKEKNFLDDFAKIVDGNEYVMFVVDDCVFTRKFSVYDACNALKENKDAIGFSLRLGRNTTYCYPLNCENVLPEFKNYKDNILFFDWTKFAGQRNDFGYPLEVSSSIYKTRDLLPVIDSSYYNSPNSLEWFMFLSLSDYTHLPKLFCYETSVAFCNPINKVQNENNNRFGKQVKHSQENLLALYEKSYIIDYTNFRGFISNGCHQEVELAII